MGDITRINTFIKTLREARSTKLPGDYNNQPPVGKFATLFGNLYDLCWEISAATKLTDTANKIIAADQIKYNATNVIAICVTELKAIGRADEAVIELIAIDGALWFWSLNAPPLNKLDQEIDPIERIQSLTVAMGNLAEWWPIDISPENPLEHDEKLEQVFVNLAYEATCAIIAHNHTTETETHND